MKQEEKEERRNMKAEEGWREGKDKRKEGGRAIGRGGKEEREGGRVGRGPEGQGASAPGASRPGSQEAREAGGQGARCQGARGPRG